MFKRKKQRAQTILEYTIVIGLIVVIMIAMGPYLQRTIQGSIRLTADQIGFQENADQDFSVGYLERSFATTRTVSNKTTNEGQHGERGTTEYLYDDATNTTSNAQVNLGFIEAPPR